MRIYRDAIVATLSTKKVLFFVDVLFVVVQRIASRFVNELSSSIREAGVPLYSRQVSSEHQPANLCN